MMTQSMLQRKHLCNVPRGTAVARASRPCHAGGEGEGAAVAFAKWLGQMLGLSAVLGLVWIGVVLAFEGGWYTLFGLALAAGTLLAARAVMDR